jgi:hypothetical protein
MSKEERRRTLSARLGHLRLVFRLTVLATSQEHQPPPARRRFLSVSLTQGRSYAKEVDGLRSQSEGSQKQQSESVGGVRGVHRAEARKEEEKVMKWWEEFADTLNTRGGTIALLFMSCVGLFFGVMHVMHHGDTGQAAAVIISTFSGFTGALLVALTGKDRPNGNNNGGTKTP